MPWRITTACPTALFLESKTEGGNGDFELKMSQMIAIWRDIIEHYKDNKEKQEQVFLELVNEIRKAVHGDTKP